MVSKVRDCPVRTGDIRGTQSGSSEVEKNWIHRQKKGFRHRLTITLSYIPRPRGPLAPSRKSIFGAMIGKGSFG